MSCSKKRKIDNECRIFNEKWSEQYFVVENRNSALCLICNESIAVLKEYNIRRHFDTKHGQSKYAQLSGKLRIEKVDAMKASLKSQRNILTKRNDENESVVRASYKIAHILAKEGKPFSDGEIVKSCILKAIEELCPDKLSLVGSISLSRNTMTRRTEDLGKDVNRQLMLACKQFECFSLAMDESTDTSDAAQVLLFIRGVSIDFQITEELAGVHSMETSVTGVEIFSKVKETILGLGLDFTKLKGITTDGGKNMSGTKTGVVGNVCKAVEDASGERPIILHCIIHQQALCGKNLEISEVMTVVVKTVNYIRSSSQKHRQFKAFLSEIDSNYPDVPYHCEVRWLSRGKVLQRFFELREPIDIFMTDQGRQVPELSDPVWLWKLAFLVDITMHINFLNLKLQGADSLVNNAYLHIKAFRNKLILFEKQLSNTNLDHFETCQQFLPEASVPFPSEFAIKIVRQLSQQFNNRFQDFDKECNKINMFQNPFNCDIDSVPSSLQLEFIDLTTNEMHKAHFNECYKNGNVLPFYSALPEDDFKNIRKFARNMVSVFGSTYVCEQAFSKMNFIKSKFRSSLTDEHLKSLLMIGTTKFEPKWKEILSSKQFQASH